MRRITCVFLCILLLAACVLPAYALSSASTSVHSTVSANGECQVVITATIHLDERVENLTYPIPREAYSVKLDGSRARTEKTDSALLVDLSKKAGNMTGDLPITITYNLSDVVVQTATGTQVQIPLLSGFRYPIDEFSFSVTLPGEITSKPAFSGGYQMAGIEKDLDYTIDGPKISGYALTGLMDNETLLFTVDVPTDMFPRTAIVAPKLKVFFWGMGISAAVALLYWLLTLRAMPPRRIHTTTVPEGYTAGQLTTLLNLQGPDLTLTIFTWARLGYVTLQYGARGHILVSRQMEMGNERSSFERVCFQKLFRKGDVVDTASLHYATLRQKAAANTTDAQDLVKKRSGNPMLFRVPAALSMMFCCGALGVSISSGAVLQWVLAVLFALAGLPAGWFIQQWAFHLFGMDKRPIRNSLLICAVCLLLGLLSKQFGVALLGCVLQLLAGLMAAFGGRRTEAGKQAMAQVLGLHRHLRQLSREDLQQIAATNPDYFQTMAPAILALGVDRSLARHLGRTPIPVPTYLSSGSEKSLPPIKWSLLMRQTVARMDARYRSLSLHQIRRFLSGVKHS